jgi:hypothetical protein
LKNLKSKICNLQSPRSVTAAFLIPKVFHVMAHRVCPWWIGYLLASPLRRWLGQDPAKILSPYVREGMTILEPGSA